MFMRTFAALILVLGIGNGLHAQLKSTTANVGDHLEIRMSGDLARKYVRSIFPSLKDDYLVNNGTLGSIVIVRAAITQQLDDGRIRIEHTSPLPLGLKKKRLVTLTATITPAEIGTKVTPKGTLVRAIGSLEELRPTTESTETLELRLSDLSKVKLRSWTLAEETGE